jgi:hypothetical protein
MPLSRIVTTSWDDGDVTDLRIAALLRDRKLAGTFYVPIAGHHRSGVMGARELITLRTAGFEIGAHGTSHLTLPTCNREQLTREVEFCKKHLEDLLGDPVRMFAYPRGKYTNMVIQAVKRAGYAGARTTQMLVQNLAFDPYRMPTTVHVYPHSPSVYVRNAIRAADFAGAWKYLMRLRHAGSWVELSKVLFDLTLRRGGIWHLYGHSWEVDELQLWDDLEEILDYVSGRADVLYLPNAAALDMLPSQKSHLPCNDVCPSEK